MAKIFNNLFNLFILIITLLIYIYADCMSLVTSCWIQTWLLKQGGISNSSPKTTQNLAKEVKYYIFRDTFSDKEKNLRLIDESP